MSTAEFIAVKDAPPVQREDQDRVGAVVPIKRPCSRWRDHLAGLLRRAASGDTDAFMEFYDHTSAVAYRVVLSRLADPVVADAATQALYVHAWDRAETHADSGLSPMTWLLSAAASAPGLHRPSRMLRT